MPHLLLGNYGRSNGVGCGVCASTLHVHGVHGGHLVKNSYCGPVLHYIKWATDLNAINIIRYYFTSLSFLGNTG